MADEDDYSGIKPLVRLLCYLISFGGANYIVYWHLGWNDLGSESDWLWPLTCFFLTQLFAFNLGLFMDKQTTGVEY